MPPERAARHGGVRAAATTPECGEPPDAAGTRAGTAAVEVVHRVSLLNRLAALLLLLGAFDWGCVGLFGSDVVTALFGAASAFTRGLQMLIGLSSVYAVWVVAGLLRSGRRAPEAPRKDYRAV
ncbi:MAG: hypothetical protein NVS9B10_02710 [Nevskia sp.]